MAVSTACDSAEVSPSQVVGPCRRLHRCCYINLYYQRYCIWDEAYPFDYIIPGSCVTFSTLFRLELNRKSNGYMDTVRAHASRELELCS